MIETLTPTKLGKRKLPIDHMSETGELSLNNTPTSASCSPSRMILGPKRARTNSSMIGGEVNLHVVNISSSSAINSPFLEATLAISNSSTSSQHQNVIQQHYNINSNSSTLSNHSSPNGFDPSQHAKKVLEAMDKSQLLQFISSLMNHSTSTRESIQEQLAPPTLENVSSILSRLEIKLNDTFPYNRWGRDTSDYAYNRVHPVLQEIQETCEMYLAYFTDIRAYPVYRFHEYPAHAFGYLHLATNLIHSLPKWSSEHHNVETKHRSYVKIAEAWKLVIEQLGKKIKEEGLVFGLASVAEWYSYIKQHHSQLEGQFGFHQVMNKFELEFGWMVGAFSGSI